MSDDKKPRFQKAGEQIDLRLGDLLGELGSALSEMMGRLESGSSQEMRRDYTVETARGPMRAETGIRIRVAGTEMPGPPPGRPRPGNRPQRATSSTSEPPPPRPIRAEILAADGEWQLVADLPGIPREALTLVRDGADLVVTAEDRGRSYRGRFALPEGIELDDIEVSLRNGILELTAPLSGKP